MRKLRPRFRTHGIPRSGKVRAGRWAPLLLLALSLGIAGTAVFQAQSAMRSHRATAEGLLRDYAAFAAWSYRQHAEDRLGAAFTRAFAPVREAYQERGVLISAGELMRYGQGGDTLSCSCSPLYSAPYYFRLPLADGEAEFVGQAPDSATRAEIVAALRGRVGSEMPAQGWSEGMLALRAGDATRYIAFAVWNCKQGGGLFAYGFEVDPRIYRPLFQQILEERPLLPQALLGGRTSAEVVSVEVRSPDPRPLYASGGADNWRLASSDTLGRRHGGLTVRATVRPEVAGSLVIGGLPRSRVPWLLGLLGLSVGLAAIAVYQLRREGELARLRSDFVASVSHELRTPLAQVRLFLETLRLGRYSTDEQREWILENLDRETNRLTGLVDNVLHFSRAERGNTGGDRESVELADYLAQLVDAFAPLAQSRRTVLETDLEPGLVAPLHRESFRQVVLNLLDNAVKYGPMRQTVRIGARSMGDRVRITVEDEGPGVEPGERERIWEPFRRGERAIGSVAVGSGIGLSVVREIVQWHGGRAWVEPGAGGGARFVLDLPGWRDTAVLREETERPALQRVG
jgi:signal transduction histidine kinase